MVQFLPGAETTIAPALVQLTEALGKALDPNFEKRQQYQNALMMNPGLLQSVADAYRNNPQILQQMGLTGGMGNSAAAIEGMVLGTPQSLESLTTNATREEIKRNPDAISEIVSRQVYGVGTKEKQVQDRELEIRAKRAADLEAVYRNAPDLVNIDIDDLAKKAAFGKHDPKLVQRVLASPIAAQYFSQRVNDFTNERVRDEERNERNIERQRQSTAMERQERQHAFQMWQQSKGMGTPELWRRIIYDAETQEEMAKFKSGELTPTNEYGRNLLAIANRMDTDQTLNSIYQKNKVRSALRMARTNLMRDWEDDQARETLINEYNDIANEATLMGISAPQAFYDDGGVLLPDKIKFRVGDQVFKNGEEAEQAAFDSHTGQINTSFTSKVEQLDQLIRNTAPELQMQVLADAEKLNPDVAKAVRRRLKQRMDSKKSSQNEH